MQGRAKHIRVLLLCITFFLVSHGRGSHTGPARERWGEASFQLDDVGALAVCGFRIHPKSNSYNFLPLNIQVDWPYYRQVNPATPKSNQQLNELNNKITNLFFTFLIRFHLITHLDDPNYNSITPNKQIQPHSSRKINKSGTGQRTLYKSMS